MSKQLSLEKPTVVRRAEAVQVPQRLEALSIILAAKKLKLAMTSHRLEGIVDRMTEVRTLVTQLTEEVQKHEKEMQKMCEEHAKGNT